MPNVDASNRIAKTSIESPEELSKELDKSYEKLANGINTKTDTIVQEIAPTTDDYEYGVGTHWIDEAADKVYVLTSRLTQETVNWTEVS